MKHHFHTIEEGEFVVMPTWLKGPIRIECGKGECRLYKLQKTKPKIRLPKGRKLKVAA